MINSSFDVAKDLGLLECGKFVNNDFEVDLENSDNYEKFYRIFEKLAVNTGRPTYKISDEGNTQQVTSYFEYYKDNDIFNLFLIADFEKNEYKLKIREKI